MNSNFGLEEQFDIELKKSEPTDLLSFKGVMQVIHKREGKILSVDTGSNIITDTGKAELVNLMGKLVDADGATGGDNVADDSNFMGFHYIGIGRRGDVQASASDVMLGGAETKLFAKENLVTYIDGNQSPKGYYVHDDIDGGYEYNGAIVNDNTPGTAVVVSPRTSGNGLGTAGTAIVNETVSNFYNGTSQTTIEGDTFLWHGKFVFSNIDTGDPIAYTTSTITINEAGIFNRPHDYANYNPTHVANPTIMPVMLARRTFSDKPVKNADELTIKWQITIK